MPFAYVPDGFPKTLLLLLLALGLAAGPLHAQKSLYHKGWVDFNKNGRRDVYEDVTQPLEKRVDDLLAQMTLDEKTCQMATLYGFGRVLKDEMPTPGWKNEVWKDGIANIDEELNGVRNTPKAASKYTYPVQPARRGHQQRAALVCGGNAAGHSRRFHQRGHSRAEPRPRHALAGAHRHGQQLGQGPGAPRRRNRGPRSQSPGLHQRVRAHSGPRPRPALGPRGGMLRRRPLPHRGAGQADGPRRAGPGRGLHAQALRRVQRAQGRARRQRPHRPARGPARAAPDCTCTRFAASFRRPTRWA